jgi:hypothetical protein
MALSWHKRGRKRKENKKSKRIVKQVLMVARGEVVAE